jgi:Flp pilus assembly protein TadD
MRQRPSYDERSSCSRKSGDAQAAYGSLFVARGQLEAAAAAFDRALKIRPDADDVRLDLARTFERLGRTAEAAN